MAHAPSIDFWFDPSCPFTWLTSRWVKEVAEARGYAVAWHPFSLKFLNDRVEGEDAHAEAHALGHRLDRVVETVRARHGAEHLDALYTALGTRVHHDGRHDVDEIIAESLAEAGLPAELADAADDASADAGLHASTDEALAKVGEGVGLPILAVDGRAFFGPVFTGRPQGDEALEIWDAYVRLTSFGTFFELKRQIRGDLVL